MNDDPHDWHADTRVLHGEQGGSSDDASVVAPIHHAAPPSEFAMPASSLDMATRARHPAHYTRYGNPVHERVAAIIAGLEGTETALLTASSMGAISTTVLALVSPATTWSRRRATT